jgi:hypothetical protein
MICDESNGKQFYFQMQLFYLFSQAKLFMIWQLNCYLLYVFWQTPLFIKVLLKLNVVLTKLKEVCKLENQEKIGF